MENKQEALKIYKIITYAISYYKISKTFYQMINNETKFLAKDKFIALLMYI